MPLRRFSVAGIAVVEPTPDLTFGDEPFAVAGDPDAPVVIYEFSDYQCPFCQRFYADTKAALDEAYVDFIDPELEYSSESLLGKHENLMILRSFSKGYSLAGKEFSLADEEIYTLPLPVPSDFWAAGTKKEGSKRCPANP